MLEDMQKKMLAARRLNHQPPTERFSRQERFPYKLQTVVVFEGQILDPKRAVLKEWKPTIHDGILTMRSEGNLHDVGDGMGVDVDDGIYKIRHLVRPKLGMVEQISAIDYLLCKLEAKNSGRIRFEPVPDDTAICDPIFPKGMPSDDAKARAIAAKGLKKNPQDISVEQIFEFFKANKGTKVFKP